MAENPRDNKQEDNERTSVVIYPDIKTNLPHEITETSFGLGMLLGVAVGSLPFINFRPFNLYIIALALFHFLEYYITAKYNPKKVNSQSFLLNNGIEYTAAHTIAILECLIEGWLCPKWKTYQNSTFRKIIVITGIILVIVGQLVRSLAMHTAGKSFSHIVKVEKENDHKLVTNGVYLIFRHPSYFGFFWWAIGTQLVLLNPLTLVAFAFVLHGFFSKRIAFEERHLVEFFGDEYIQYRKSVKIWIPFIKDQGSS
ncbi:protein-S-isoprenylcysteine O-methyltransferase [Monosporozyma unispora]|nr:farnesyl cysteine-carboxyl methyltransferase [Kazachstania unispora]